MMLAARADEIGFIVRDIDARGRIRVSTLGHVVHLTRHWSLGRRSGSDLTVTALCLRRPDA